MDMYNNSTEKDMNSKYSYGNIIIDFKKYWYMKQLLCSIEYGNIKVTKYIYYRFYKHIDIHYDIEWPFQLACREGHLHIAKWIHSLCLKTIPVNIIASNNYVFQYSPPHILKWLETL